MKVSLSLATLWSLASISSAALLPRASTTAFCSRNDVVYVTNALKSVATPASKYCASFISVSTPIPATVTVTQSATSTSTTVITGTVTGTVTITRFVTVTVTASSTTSIPGTTQTTVVTSTSYSAAPLLKRAEITPAAVLDKRSEPCPKPLSSVASSLASQICSCFLGLPRPTTTITVTTVVSETSSATVTTTATTTASVTSTVTTTGVTTITGPSTTTTSTVVVTTPVVYNQVRSDPNGACVYNRYYDYRETSNDPANSWRAGRNECQDRCSNDPQCKFWFFLHFDPAKARGYDGSNCILDNLPYDAAYVQCGYVNNFDVAYNKVSP